MVLRVTPVNPGKGLAQEMLVTEGPRSEGFQVCGCLDAGEGRARGLLGPVPRVWQVPTPQGRTRDKACPLCLVPSTLGVCEVLPGGD